MATTTTDAITEPEESGIEIHRRETRRQIWLPFIGGVFLVVLVFAIMAIPSDADARLRAQAVADWTWSILCLIPIIFACLMPLYLIAFMGIWGMNKLHDGVERPLTKLEKRTDEVATRLESIMLTWDERMINWRTRLEPFLYYLRIFDRKPVDIDQEIDDNA